MSKTIIPSGIETSSPLCLAYGVVDSCGEACEGEGGSKGGENWEELRPPLTLRTHTQRTLSTALRGPPMS